MKFGIFKPHFRKRQEGSNSIGCEVCNQPKKPKQKIDRERTWRSLQTKYAAAAAAMAVQDCPDWTAGRKCKRGITCAKTYAHDPEKVGICAFYSAGKECKYASQCPFGPSGHWKPPPAAEEPQQVDAAHKRARPTHCRTALGKSVNKAKSPRGTSRHNFDDRKEGSKGLEGLSMALEGQGASPVSLQL